MYSLWYDKLVMYHLWWPKTGHTEDCFGHLKVRKIWFVVTLGFYVVSTLVYQSLHEDYCATYRSCDFMVTLNSLCLVIIIIIITFHLYSALVWLPLVTIAVVLQYYCSSTGYRNVDSGRCCHRIAIYVISYWVFGHVFALLHL